MEPKKQWLARLRNELSNNPLVSNAAFGFILMGLEKLVELEFRCPCSPTWNGLFSSAFFIVSAIMVFILMLIIQRRRHKELILKFIAQEGKCDEFILKSITGRCSCDKSTLKLITKGCSCDESTLKLIKQVCSCDESTVTLIIQRCRCDKSSRFTWCELFKNTVSSSVAAIVWLILLFLDGQYFTCAMTDWKGRFVLIDKAALQKWCEPISEGNFTSQELMLRSQEWIAISQVIGMSLLLFLSFLGLTVYLIREHRRQNIRRGSLGSGSLVPGTPPETTYQPLPQPLC